MGTAEPERPGSRRAAREDGTCRGVDENRLVRKLDAHLIPLIMSLYLFSFVDRVNVGNARLYKLEADLGLSSHQFQVVVSIFFVTYMLFEVPSNLVLKLFTPRRWIAFITLSWGLVATLSGLVDSYAGLVACRLLLGALEAGLFPGLNVYLTFFYTKHELALRVGYLFVSAAIAGALGGLLAYGIGHLDGVRGMSGWRWIFILEGIPSVVLGVVAYFALPNDAASAYFLAEEDKAVMEVRRRRAYGSTRSSEDVSRKDVARAFTDWKAWAFYIAQFGVDTMLYGFSTFLPTIIQALGSWTSAQVQLLTIPCYFFGAATFMGAAYLSDRLQQRGLFCVAFGTISVVGYAVLLADVAAPAHYFACFLVAGGLYVVVGLPLAWLPNNSPRYGKRTTATGMQLTFGNAAGVMSAFIYPKSDQPRYVRGHAVCLAMVGMGTAIYAFLWYWLRRVNAARERGLVSDKHRGLADEQLQELGDDSPGFRYTV
ncbi:uncharacterized protein UV8b_05104 [Ustilaginoidea virens]|uniref:MFS transporter n=1 Tax=Ustilaginoidea virens TaxID=1159556 RepID=A0A8E5HST8_USTVR|nr:uncharacterized protein UV8b_05104 [Ustilaginoidea virens]QUC20863.1 hypothetical protein UV8b_05104 [Ustilaginoidea virens]